MYRLCARTRPIAIETDFIFANLRPEVRNGLFVHPILAASRHPIPICPPRKRANYLGYTTYRRLVWTRYRQRGRQWWSDPA